MMMIMMMMMMMMIVIMKSFRIMKIMLGVTSKLDLVLALKHS